MSHPIDGDPIDEDTSMRDEGRHANADVPGRVVSVDPSSSSDEFEPSDKLRARVEKLAHWRIGPSIRFGDGDAKAYGGHATVSRHQMNVKGVDRRDLEKRALGKRLDRKAIDEFLRRRERTWLVNVAVKKMRVGDDTDFERVLGLAIREAEFLAELSHPNIVELEGFVEDLSNCMVWLVFPWADYGNLKEFIASEKWEIPEKISLISDVVQGLEYLHSQNPPICHGDLKSLNVLIYSHGEKINARLTDFGSARRLPKHDPSTQIEEVQSLTRSTQPLNASFRASTNTITLTGNKYSLRWAAPELLIDDQLSLWSDIWALGWVAYEVMTESLPFEDVTSDVVVVERVLEGKLPSLADSDQLLFIHELCSLMSMCWKIQPTDRPTADSCLKSIEKMPMFAPEMYINTRILSPERLRELGHMYQSRGEYARAFDFFALALEQSRAYGADEVFSSLRDLAQLARLRKDYSETIALFDVVWKINGGRDEKALDTVSGALCDLAELYRLRNETNRAIESHSEGQEIKGQERIVKGLCDIAQQHRLQNRHDKAIPLYTQALNIHTDSSDRKSRADALWALAETHRLQNHFNDAITLCSEALEIYTDLGDRKCGAETLCSLGQLYRLRNEYNVTIETSSEGRDIKEEERIAEALCRLADERRREKQCDEAIPLYFEASKIYANLGHRKGRAEAWWGLGEVYRLQGEYNGAIAFYSDALEIYTALGDRKGKADALCNLGQIYRLRNEYNNATEIDSERRDIKQEKWIAEALCSLADVLRRQKQCDEAIPLYSEASEIHASLRQWKDRALALRGLAEVYRLQGDYIKAIPLYSESLKTHTDLGDRKGRVDALWDLAEVYQLQAEYNKAIPLYTEALEIYTDFGDRKRRAEALSTLGKMHRLRNAYNKTIEINPEGRDTKEEERIAKALCSLAYERRLEKRCDEAIPLYSEASKLYADLGHWKGRDEAIWGLGEVYRLQGEYNKAIPLYFESLKTHTGLGNGKHRAKDLSNLGKLHRLRNEYNKTIETNSEGRDIKKEKRIAKALCSLADVHQREKQHDEATPSSILRSFKKLYRSQSPERRSRRSMGSQ